MHHANCGVIPPWSAKSFLLLSIIFEGEDTQSTLLDNCLSIALFFCEDTYLFPSAFKFQLSIFPSIYCLYSTFCLTESFCSYLSKTLYR